jgi:bifunctional non-homologous end joining protein LigD
VNFTNGHSAVLRLYVHADGAEDRAQDRPGPAIPVLRRRAAPDAVLHAFDLLELNGKDLRPLPLGERKAKLGRLLARASAGIVFNEHTDDDGAVVFRHACKLGLEGIVSKRLSAPYRSGPSRDWLKTKNPDSPAMIRHREGRWEK